MLVFVRLDRDLDLCQDVEQPKVHQKEYNHVEDQEQLLEMFEDVAEG